MGALFMRIAVFEHGSFDIVTDPPLTVRVVGNISRVVILNLPCNNNTHDQKMTCQFLTNNQSILHTLGVVCQI